MRIASLIWLICNTAHLYYPSPPLLHATSRITPYLGKSVRFNATLPENLLQRIDDRVQKDHRYASRSGFLAAAALRELLS